MTFQFDNPAPKRNWAMTAQRALRVMTIVVAALGIAFIAWRWMDPPRSAAARTPAATPDSVPAESGETVINLRNYPFGDNVTKTSAETDNAGAVAAIVGLDAVRDNAPVARLPLYYLLREVEQKYPADDFFMKRIPEVKLRDLQAAPDAFRGKPVMVRGDVVRVDVSTLPENPSGVRTTLDGQIFVPGEGLCFFITSRTGTLRVGTSVELRGLFLQTVRYEAENHRMESAPLIVASHPLLTAPPAPALPASGEGVGALLGVLVTLFAAYVVIQFMLRRRAGSGNRAVEARRKARELLGRPLHDDEDVAP